MVMPVSDATTKATSFVSATKGGAERGLYAPHWSVTGQGRPAMTTAICEIFSERELTFTFAICYMLSPVRLSSVCRLSSVNTHAP